MVVWLSNAKPKKTPPGSYDILGDRRAARRISGWVAIATFFSIVVTLVFGSSTIVSTKNIGVVTNFGSPDYSLTNGFHWKAPWSEVTEMDGAIQTDNHLKAKDDQCISVRLANQSVACVDTSIRWRIKEDATVSLFKDYKVFDNVRDSLVTRELTSSLNTVFADYNPLAVDDQGNLLSSISPADSAKATATMAEAIGDQIDVLNVFVPIIHFDPATQDRLDALQQQIAQTRIAEQAEKTATAQALANKQLSASVSNDPNVLVSKCYDLLGEMVSKSQLIPTGFSCWPGGSSAIVVPSASR